MLCRGRIKRASSFTASTKPSSSIELRLFIEWIWPTWPSYSDSMFSVFCSFLEGWSLSVCLTSRDIFGRLRSLYVTRPTVSGNVAIDDVAPFSISTFASWDYSINQMQTRQNHQYAVSTVLKVSLFVWRNLVHLLSIDPVICRRAEGKTKQGFPVDDLKKVLCLILDKHSCLWIVGCCRLHHLCVCMHGILHEPEAVVPKQSN
jgi:hypothetical protein